MLSGFRMESNKAFLPGCAGAGVDEGAGGGEIEPGGGGIGAGGAEGGGEDTGLLEGGEERVVSDLVFFDFFFLGAALEEGGEETIGREEEDGIFSVLSSVIVMEDVFSISDFSFLSRGICLATQSEYNFTSAKNGSLIKV